jgi:hypothetical protein
MTDLLRRLHVWVGLLNLTILIVFAVAGINATILEQEDGEDGKDGEEEARVVDYTPPGDLSDVEVAAHMHAALDLPYTRRIADWAIGRNGDGVLVLNFYSPNGVYRATLLEADRQVRIEHRRNSLGAFANQLHAYTSFGPGVDPRLRLWALYVVLSIASLLFMAATGLWLWLAARPSLWWARVSFVTGAGLFVLLWVVGR